MEGGHHFCNAGTAGHVAGPALGASLGATGQRGARRRTSHRRRGRHMLPKHTQHLLLCVQHPMRHGPEQTELSSQIRAGDVGSTTRLRPHECASFVRLHRDSGPGGNDGGRAPRSRGRHGRVRRFASRGGALQPGLCLSSSPQVSDMRGHEDLTSTDPPAGADRARSRSLRRRRRVSPDWDV